MTTNSGNLIARDREMFATFQIPLSLVEQARIFRVDDQGAREFGFQFSVAARLDGLVYPYFDPLAPAHRVSARLRRDTPDLDPKTGKATKNKYISAYGDRKHLFFPPRCAALIEDTNVARILGESEKSCLALYAWAAREGRKLLPIALGGCYGWHGKIGRAENAQGQIVEVRGALPELRLVCPSGSEVVVWFDRNADPPNANPQVRAARAKLTDELLSYGCRVFRAGYDVDTRFKHRAVAL